jgi:hypothetical protein
MMRDDTKLARIREAMRIGDWDTALKIASRFQRLDDKETAIKRAANAVNNPSFYQQLGHDLGKLKAEGVAALKERFGKSWSAVQDDKKKSGKSRLRR